MDIKRQWEVGFLPPRGAAKIDSESGAVGDLVIAGASVERGSALDVESARVPSAPAPPGRAADTSFFSEPLSSVPVRGGPLALPLWRSFGDTLPGPCRVGG